MAKSAKSVVFSGDFHVGSATALCSAEPYVREIDSTIKPNKIQQALREAYYDTIDSITQTPELLVVNGEPIDGANKKQLGNQSWTTNQQDMSDDFIKLMGDFPYKKIMCGRGSAYHSNVDGMNWEEIIADKLNAEKYKAYGGKGHTDYFGFFEMNGRTFNFTHHIGFNKMPAYRTTALAREIAGMHFEKDKLGEADVLVRSHIHYFVYVRFVHSHGFTTPAWKYPDGHLFRGGLAGTTPDIGAVEVIVEPNGDLEVIPHIAEIDLKPQVRHF